MKNRAWMAKTAAVAVVAGALLAANPSRAIANESTEPPPITLTIHPADEAPAALTHRLLPPLLERRDGDAASFYYRAMIQLAARDEEEAVRVAELLDVPVSELPQDEVAKLVGDRAVLEELHSAVRRERCDWQLPIGEQNPLKVQLPELGQLRDLARLVALRARLQIAQGRLDEAVETLQCGYAMARHVAQGPTLINALVGMAIVDMMAKQVQELIQHPAAPNMYWALTTLPSPLIEVLAAAETEMNLLYLMYPDLRHVDDSPRTPEYWREFIGRIVDDFEMEIGNSEVGWEPLAVAVAIRGYPQAKRDLIARGLDPQRVEAMPVAQVVLLHSLRTYEQARDDTFKWFALPYWQAAEGMRDNRERLMIIDARRDREVVPLASLLLPPLQGVKSVEAQTDRTIAALRTVEAIRMYAARHDGQLPQRLSDIRAVPTPIDPVTGKPFPYRLKGSRATIELPKPPGYRSRNQPPRIELQLAPKE